MHSQCIIFGWKYSFNIALCFTCCYLALSCISAPLVKWMPARNPHYKLPSLVKIHCQCDHRRASRPGCNCPLMHIQLRLKKCSAQPAWLKLSLAKLDMSLPRAIAKRRERKQMSGLSFTSFGTTSLLVSSAGGGGWKLYIQWLFALKWFWVSFCNYLCVFWHCSIVAAFCCGFHLEKSQLFPIQYTIFIHMKQRKIAQFFRSPACPLCCKWKGSNLLQISRTICG